MKRRLLYNKKNQYILIVLLIIVLFMSVGYAYLKEQLTISGISNIVTGFNIEIVSIQENEMVNAETINLKRDKTKGIIEVNLNKKGAKAVYDVTVKNSGELDATLNSIKGITEANQMEPLDITVKTEGIQPNMTLLKNQTMVFQIIVEWDSNVTSSNNELDKTIEFEVEYQQKTEDPVFPPYKYKNGEIIYFNPETNQKCSASEYKPGNSLNQNKSGCMKWYAFNDSESSDTVNVILDHNTTAKVAWNTSGNNADGMKEVKTALDNDTKAWNSNLKPRLIESNEIAKITGNTEFDASNKDKDDWFYFENNSQENPNLSQDQAKYKWLFDYTYDCTSYGCSIDDSSTWGYWTSTPYASKSYGAWSVYYFGYLDYFSVDFATYFGVRPVISIDKTVLDQEVPKPTPTPTPSDPNFVDIIKDKNTSNNTEGLFTDDFGNIRYGGKNVKNYVKFNNETWRIIGIFDNKVKLMRESSIPKQSWSTDYNNNWQNAFLNRYLNSGVYNGMIEEAKSLIEESNFVSGGSSSVLLTRKELYQNERSSGTSGLQKIGLIYASDYMYATGTACAISNAGNIGNQVCIDSNWMYRNVSEWTQSINTGVSTLAWSVDSSGGLGFTNIGQYLDVRPVVYLKNNIKITGGTGTQSDPYIIE